nr:9841_t:CDS:2 [Entrophospora candida]
MISLVQNKQIIYYEYENFEKIIAEIVLKHHKATDEEIGTDKDN